MVANKYFLQSSHNAEGSDMEMIVITAVVRHISPYMLVIEVEVILLRGLKANHCDVYVQ